MDHGTLRATARVAPIGVNLSTAVILSAAKDLCPRRIRPFAALRVTSDGRLPESVALENLLKLTLMGSPLPYAIFVDRSVYRRAGLAPALGIP